MTFINIDILRHPTNWLFVFILLLIWIFFFDLAHAFITGRHPAEPAQTTAS